MKHDPRLVEANMQYQFQKLIAEPFGGKQLLPPACLLPIFIDGLDQCRGHETQRQILQLIGKFISNYPFAPLLWIITSRPDRRLLKEVEEFSPKDRTRMDFIPVNSDDARADVKHFLQTEFSGCQRYYGITAPWPEKDDFSRIQASVSGYFMIASAIAQFVGHRDVEDPVSQLDTVLALSPEKSTPELSNPFVTVHKLYMEIITTVPDVHYRTARRIIGFYLLPHGFGAYDRQSTSFWALCNILGIKQNVAYASLSKLRPLLDVPEPNDAFDTPIRFFHASFADFLTNRDASENFWIDVKEVVDDLWQCHFRILQQANPTNTPLPQPNKVEVAWSSTLEEAQQTRIRIWRNAQRVFFHQLLPCPAADCAMGIHYDELSSKGSTKRTNVLQKINFDNIVDRYTLPDVPYRLLIFLDWLIEGDDELIHHNLWKKLDHPGQVFDWIKKDGISFRIDVQHSPEGGSLITFRAYTDLALVAPDGVYSEGLFSTSEPPAKYSQLLSELTSQKDTISTSVVVGAQTVGQCALLVDKSIEDLTVYYVVSYTPAVR
ncbi:hypothetical protein P691DRAFT_777589 [Macrolepiota fuliginosa MF-IS2]|uniref:NACHT domain-containing protein n=1 Tax=Macrolepiota fuliginosa MF-IS2 TaxID=1400762 RepID=A0A9P5X6G5_9AGAR|nr:hypothetical protein P691DRAFT_777589 [Macrolepiota fuliginosa MF-IS2]